MAMRLQPKAEVLEKQAAEQRQHINEGLAIAKRIDALRETQAQEDASLEKFRREKVGAINVEIEETRKILRPLQSEVADLRKERAELMKPLDKEWADIALARESVQKLVLVGDSRFKEAKNAEAEARESIEEANRRIKRADEASEAAATALSDAEKHRIEAKNAHDEASYILNDTKQMQEEVRKDLIHRLAEVSMREGGVRMKEATLNDREAALSKEWKLLEDRKAMLERNITRAKK